MATIGFSTHWPKHMKGGPTQFMQKIWKGLWINQLVEKGDWGRIYSDVVDRQNPKLSRHFPMECELWENGIIPKLHTIRKDPKDDWKSGMKIHMVVFNRSKDRFQFAPVLEVKSIQKIEIRDCTDDFVQLGPWYVPRTQKSHLVKINGKQLRTVEEYRNLALNDGFDSVDQFFHWFDKDFTGKIIHWTELNY